MRSAAGALRRRALSVGWGFVAQACSSATNFGLIVIGGHILGPDGLGGIAVGFAAYFALLGFERALIANPLVARSSSDPSSERKAPARHAVTVSLLASVPVAASV